MIIGKYEPTNEELDSNAVVYTLEVMIAFFLQWKV